MVTTEPRRQQDTYSTKDDERTLRPGGAELQSASLPTLHLGSAGGAGAAHFFPSPFARVAKAACSIDGTSFPDISMDQGKHAVAILTTMSSSQCKVGATKTDYDGNPEGTMARLR